MAAFYFDVGGVLIPDKLAPHNARNVFRELGQRYAIDPELACATYMNLQPALDVGIVSLMDLCGALGITRQSFECEWMAMHPLDRSVVRMIERLLAGGHSVGLATNFCRRLLDLLMESTPTLSRLVVCCSSDIRVAKPSIQFFHRASELMGSKDIIFIDDRITNVDAARRFGWTALVASDGWLAGFEETYLRTNVRLPSDSR